MFAAICVGLPVATQDLAMDGTKSEVFPLVGGSGWYRWSMKQYGASLFGDWLV